MTANAVTVAIVGAAGGVGSATAYTLAGSDVVDELRLVDVRRNVLESHVMDLEHLRTFGQRCHVRAADETELADADVIIVTASVPIQPDAARRDYLAQNLPTARSVGRALAGGDWAGLVLVATNPIEPACRAFADAAGLRREQVVGYALNDTLRLRMGIGRAVGIDPSRVEAWVLGEHGESLVPLWSRVRIDDEPVELDVARRTEAADYLHGWYPRIVALDSGRTTTWSTAAGLSRMVAAALEPTAAIFPGAVWLDGEYDIRDAVLSVPVRLGPGGVREIVQWPLPADELRALRHAAAAVRSD